MERGKILTLKSGSALVIAMIFIIVSLIGGAAFVALSVNEVSLCHQQANSIKAFFLAESGLQQAMYDIKNNNPDSRVFKLSDISARVNNMDDNNISLTITDLGGNRYSVISSATVNMSTRVINAVVIKEPPAQVFDYAYFINNWGWFYGRGITVNGDVRSNGRVDFRGGPTINGDIYASEEIGVDGAGIRGTGGDPARQHPNSPRLEMPNLQDLTYYENLAKTQGGKIRKGADVLVDAVYGDDTGETGNIILLGTDAEPIEVTGPVVVRNNVIIKGYIEGQGTIYAGRNIYLAGDLRYKNPPLPPRPASNDPAVIDGWVKANENCDLVGLAARGSVIIGDYTKSRHFGYNGGDRWYSDDYIFDMGSEDVGRDGIPGTGDEGENDGYFDPSYEDLDSDGVFDGNYSWSNLEIDLPISQFSYLPSGITQFSDIATNSMSKIEGIVYTNHAVAGRVGNGVQINGSVISKDEAIVYNDTIVFNYDERIRSRYRSDPNWLIDVKLPLGVKAKVSRWWE